MDINRLLRRLVFRKECEVPDWLLHRYLSYDLHSICYETLLQASKNSISDILNSPAIINSDKEYANAEDWQLEVFNRLILFGAPINARDYEKSPLAQSVLCRPIDFKLVKEHLLRGANVNEGNEKFHSPLDYALKNADWICVKFLIKVTVLQKRQVDLTFYKHFEIYHKIRRYYVECYKEVTYMESEYVDKGVTLYTFLQNTFLVPSNKVKKASMMKINNLVLLFLLICHIKYPIYGEIVCKELKSHILTDRNGLLDKLVEFEFYTVASVYKTKNGYKKKRIVLNCDCVYEIAKYLSNNQILNLIMALIINLNNTVKHSRLGYYF